MASAAPEVEMLATSVPDATDKWAETREVFLRDPSREEADRLEAAKANFMVEAGVNPFEQRTVGLFSSPLRSLKTIILIPLVVVRVCGALICLLICAILTSLAMACSGWKSTEVNAPLQPLPCFSRLCMACVPVLIRAFLFFFGFHWISWAGKPASKEEAPIMTASHQSWVESFYLGGVFLTSGIGQQENFYTPIIGNVLRLLQFIAVNRDDPESRKNSAKLMIERCADPLCPKFLIFPEGVCTSGSHLVQFKDGVFRAGLPVQPVAVFYPHEKWCSGYHPKNPMDPKATIPHLLRALFEVHNPMHVHWCEPYHPSEEEKSDSFLYARNVRKYMAEKSGKLLTEHAFEDVRLALVAKREFKIENADWVLVESGKAFDQLHFNFNDSKTMLERFEKFDTEKRGKINIDQFLKALELPRTWLTEELFKLYDITGDGTIDFREYMCAQAMVRGINAGKKREDERQVKGSPVHQESLDFVWYVITGGADGKTTIEYEDVKGMFDRFAMQPTDGITAQHLFDKARGDKAAVDREAFDRLMFSSPEYMTLIRLGEKKKPKRPDETV